MPELVYHRDGHRLISFVERHVVKQSGRRATVWSDARIRLVCPGPDRCEAMLDRPDERVCSLLEWAEAETIECFIEGYLEGEVDMRTDLPCEIEWRREGYGDEDDAAEPRFRALPDMRLAALSERIRAAELDVATLRAKIALDDDFRARLAFYDDADRPVLKSWEEAHRHHADDPYISCPFCRESFTRRAPVAAAFIALSRIGTHGALSDNERHMIQIAREAIERMPNDVLGDVRAALHVLNRGNY